MQECAAPVPFTGRTMGDNLRYTINLLNDYHICSARQAGLVRVVKGE